MNKKQEGIKLSIDHYAGGLLSAYIFINTIYKDLEIDFSNIYSSGVNNKFNTFVRNIINLKIIRRPNKHGRNLLLDSIDILSILVAKKYLNAGMTFNHLSCGYIASLSKDELYERLFADQLKGMKYLVDLYNDKKNSCDKEVETIKQLCNKIGYDRVIQIVNNLKGEI